MEGNSKSTYYKDNKVLWKEVSTFLIGIVILIIVNIVAQHHFFRWDLTEDKRYTISPATIRMLENLEDEVMVTVYLEGEINAGFLRLQKSIEEALEEFTAYAGSNLDYRFVNPLDAVSTDQRQAFFAELVNMGIEPTRVFDEEDGQRMQKLIVPGAVISYQGKKAGAMLLNGNRAAGSQEALNQSIENVEYELAKTIRQLVEDFKPNIGLLYGHGELEGVEIASLSSILEENYQLQKIDISVVQEIPEVDVLMINKPRERFEREDKYKLDQYIMAGGKAIFFIDPLFIEMDSIGENGSIAFSYDLNLDDLLFRYGLRINKTLVQDIKSGVYPFVVGDIGGQPQIVKLQWPFFPIVNSFETHPIVKNMDALYLQFASELDTVAAEGITKTPLVFTSDYSRVKQTPMIVDLMELREAPRPEKFNDGPQVVAYLLEGSFTSVFTNRVLPDNADRSTFVKNGEQTKVIVVADGEMVRNEIDRETGKPLPLNFDPISEQNFANEEFILNALSYLSDPDGLISARSKEVLIRPLDKVKVLESGTLWQLVNLLLPAVLIIVFGLIKAYIRKRKYGLQR